MADVPGADAVDPDEQLLEQIKARGTDLSIPHVVGFRIDFSPEVARQAAAELIRAGQSSVRLEIEGAPAVIVAMDMLVSLDSLRSMRAELDDFASSRDAEVTGVMVGGRDPFAREIWKKDSAATADTDQADQAVIDHLFAFDVDLKQTMNVRGGIAFAAESAAREAAAGLMLEGFPEVAVVQSDIGPVAEAVTYMTADVKALHRLRHNLSKFAESRGGTWLGFNVTARAPV